MPYSKLGEIVKKNKNKKKMEKSGKSFGSSIKSFFGKGDSKKKAKKTKKFLDDKKVSDFKRGLQGR